MKLFVVIAILCGVMALVAFDARDQDVLKKRHSETVAMNFAVYRNAVFVYVFCQRNLPMGDIPLSALALPAGFQAMRPWKARIDAKTCLVWGPASPEEIERARTFFHESFALGRAENGLLVPGHEQSVPVPGVPDGNIVSVVKLN